jgi:multidrug efflux pump subunit AcrA (membrane-fusion protein)
MKLGKPFNVSGFSANGVIIAALLFATKMCGGQEIVVPSAILSVIEKVDVPAPEAGILKSLAVREGVRVEAEQLLAQFDPHEQQLLADVVKEDLLLAEREAASDISVRLAEKENEVARVELQRAESVNADFPNTVSAKEVDRLRLAVESTKLKIEHAKFERAMLALKIRRTQADLKLAQYRVDRLAIATPIPGVVAQVDKSAGEWVDKGELVLRIVRVDRLKVEGYVAVSDSVKGLVGRPVEVEAVLDGGDPVRAHGTVAFVSPEAEPVDAQVRFWAEIDNTAMQLRPGLTVSVKILDAAASAAQLPRTRLGKPGPPLR